MNLMDELGPMPEPEYAPTFDLDKAVEEAKNEEESSGENKLHISEDVIKEIARRALTHITSVVPASSGASVLGLGRKNPEGVKISIVEEDNRSQISVDAYVLVRYGLRIPDVAWDLQEFLKNELPKRAVAGYEVDQISRDYIKEAGFAEYFVHRTGHNIAVDVSPHGPGANLDNYESHDFRTLMEGTSFSDEPGIYAPDFGVRSETDLHIKNRELIVVGGLQDEIIPIMDL